MGFLTSHSPSLFQQQLHESCRRELQQIAHFFARAHKAHRPAELAGDGHGKTGVSAGMALRLSEAFGTSLEAWIRLQANYDLVKAMRGRRVKIARLAA